VRKPQEELAWVTAQRDDARDTLKRVTAQRDEARRKLAETVAISHHACARLSAQVEAADVVVTLLEECLAEYLTRCLLKDKASISKIFDKLQEVMGIYRALEDPHAGQLAPVPPV